MMHYQLDKQRSESAYMQIYRQLREEIISGTLKAGTKLPSKRALAEELNVSIITVEHAYALLIDEGYVLSKPRSGLYASFGSGTSAPSARRASLADMRATPSGADDFPFSVWAKTMRSVLSDYDRSILTTCPGIGCAPLREALADYLQRSRDLSVSPDQIIIGSGAEYLYSLVVQLLGPGCVIALEHPSYQKIRLVYEANGARCQSLTMGSDGIVSAELASSRADALHVTPFHSFPSGITATTAKRHEYAAWAESHDSIIIEDDYDSEFASLSRQIETICSIAPERVIYINTFSKLLAPAIRTGFMILPRRLLDTYQQKLGFYSCTVPVFEQLVLSEFIEEGHMERYINRRKRKLRQNAKKPQ